MDVIKANLSRIRVPGANDKVFKDECFYSFDCPESKTGLYVCLNRFLGIGEKYLEQYSKRTDNVVFLHIKRTKKEIEEGQEVPEKVSRLAINMEGGFNTDSKIEWDEVKRIVVLPSRETVELNDPDLPLQANLSAAGILTAVSATKQAVIDAVSGTWNGEVLAVSKHADSLAQNADPPRIPPTGWKCQQCDLTNNLWLNLTDGSILCGRKFFDGSGGNNHAVDHFRGGNGGGPLAVKLGTITQDGKADVFSYDEDDMVLDPHLEKHLAHFGIRLGACEKTEKSMVEIQIEMNEKIGEWAVLTEAGNKLVPVWGPGRTGFHNLGNTCYMNSVLQVLFALPEFAKCYQLQNFLDRGDLANPEQDFKLQVSKLCRGVLSGEYSLGTEDGVGEDVLRDEGSHPGIKPVMFKNLIGKGHPEFSTNNQQDAQEFFIYLMTQVERAHHAHEIPAPSSALKFCVEDRIECSQSGQVQYKTRNEYFLPFNVPLAAAVNQKEMDEYLAKKAEAEARGERLPADQEVRYKIPFSSILQSFLGQSLVEDFHSPATGSKTVAKKSARLKTFPDHLLVSLSKYQVDENWTPVKLNVEIDMPEELDLACVRGTGVQPGEVVMADEQPAAQAPTVYTNDAVVDQLVEMGFPKEGCRRAVHETKNSGLESAMAWVMEHMGDPDFGAPFTVAGGQSTAAAAAAAVTVSEENAAMVMSMGFTMDQATAALRNTDNNVERAIEWIFSHPDGEPEPAEQPSQAGGGGGASTAAGDATAGLTDGEPRYQLSAFISHMGTSPQTGHYVCHIKERDTGRWLIFNDNKVAVSEKPPKDMGYLYLYSRQK